MNKSEIKTYPVEGQLYSISEVYVDGNKLDKDIKILFGSKEKSHRINELTIENFDHLIQIDLTNLTNLSKLTLRNSMWDNIKGVQNWETVIIDECRNASLNWLTLK